MKSNEMWKDVPEYEGLYQASNIGRIKSLERYTEDGHHVLERILKPSLAKGYLKVQLSKNGRNKTIYVHKIIATTFLDNVNNLPEVNHKDENKLNNCVVNLEWCTHKYNIHYGTAIRRMSEKQINNGKNSKKVAKYDKENKILCIYPSIMEAYRKTGILSPLIVQCCKRKRKTAGGYIWRYADEI